MRIKVMVADRHTATRAGIRKALESAGFHVVAECADAAAVADSARARANVCLIDVDLPGGGLTAVRALAARPRAPRIVVLASAARDADLFAALRAGADGFVIKDVDPSQLAREVVAVAGGEPSLSPELTARLIAEFRASGRRPSTDLLSVREEEILWLVADGLTTNEIALRLRLTPATVQRHVSAAAEKLGARDCASAVERLRAVRRGQHVWG